MDILSLQSSETAVCYLEHNGERILNEDGTEMSVTVYHTDTKAAASASLDRHREAMRIDEGYEVGEKYSAEDKEKREQLDADYICAMTAGINVDAGGEKMTAEDFWSNDGLYQFHAQVKKTIVDQSAFLLA